MSASGQIAAAADGNAVQTWSVAGGTLLQRFSTAERNRYRVSTLAVSDDGMRIAWVADGGNRLFVSRPGAEPFMTLIAPKVDALRDRMLPFALSPDGRRLALLGQGYQVRLVEVAAGAIQLPAGEGRLPDGPIVFSPDGRLLAWESGDTTISISRGGGDAIRFEAGNIGKLRFSADGRLLTGVSRDDAIRLWATDPPRLLTRLPPQRGNVQGVAITPDNRTLVVAVSTFGGVDVIRHPLSAAGLIDQACAVLQRNLSADEWREHLGVEPYRATCPSIPPAAAVRGAR